MRVVFMGTPEFAVPCLAAVAAEHQVALVVTQPDKPAGRGGKLTAPPVKLWATAHGLPVIQPPSMRRPEVAAELAAVGAELAVVVAYGKILPPAVLTAFPRGCVNVHGSLLPAYRGAAPVQWAVLDGLTHTGVSVMQLDEGMDTGPVFATREVAIGDATAGALMTRLSEVGAALLAEVLRGIAAGTARAAAQPGEGVSHARMLARADGYVDPGCPALVVAARIRGADPWPGALAERRGERIKLFGATIAPAPSPPDAVPGQILAITSAGATMACGDGAAVVIGEMQLPGRKRLRCAELASGRALAVGDQLVAPVDPPPA
ncbi:MAG: methionyl-tRNA formyltransferase [Kofleriaceae bacterium]|nr:methionyl-tRNA formyltransferase [Kofleriaceae bacterium]